jgi:hypothetical protein
VQPVLSFVTRATVTANSHTVTFSPESKAFAGGVINRCLQRGGHVVVEEIHLGVPETAMSSCPPRAALVVSCIGRVVPRVLQEILAQSKAPDATGEPRSKAARNDLPQVMPHEIVSCLEDQGCVFSYDDFDEQSVQQLEVHIRDALGPEKWYERVQQEWGDRLLFDVLPLRPPMDVMPLAWRDGALDDAVRVIGLMPSAATSYLDVVRPCFSSFTRFTMPPHEELQALANWTPRSLAAMVPVLMETKGFSFVKSVQLIQDEALEALKKAPHAGVGIDAAHRYVFETVRSTSGHICKCQRCLRMLSEMRSAFTDGFGLFSVYSYLFEKLGANTARSTCALLMMLTSHLLIGSVDGRAMSIALMLLGATSIGKTFILNMIRKMLPRWVQDSASSKSNQASLSGDPLANIPNTLVAGNRKIEMQNELMIPETTTQALDEYGDAYATRTRSMTGKDAVWYDPITRTAVWFCKIVIAASNSICGNGAPNPAILQRFTHITGMTIPDMFATIWQDKHAQAESDCAELLSQCLCAAIDIQNFILNELRIVPSFAWMMSAFQSLTDEKNITPRAVATMRSSVPAAWIADRTAFLVLTCEHISITDLLIARCLPIPIDFMLSLIQPVAGTGVDSGHIDAFGNLSKVAVVPDRFRLRDTNSQDMAKIVPPGFVTLAGVAQANTRRRDEVLRNAARNTTPDTKSTAEDMAVSLMAWPKIEDFGVSVDLLTMRPPKDLLAAASEVLRILSEMLDLDMLLENEQKTHVYLPHGFVRWLNAQDGPDADPFRQIALGQTVNTPQLMPDRKIVSLAPPADADALRHFEAMMKRTHGYFAEMAALRTQGLAFALIHCGLEYPYLVGSQNYEMDSVLQRFMDVNQIRVQPPQGAPSAVPRDFANGPAPLRNIDMDPEVLPPRISFRSLANPPIGVPPSLRKLAASMRLPYPIEVPMANNGRFVLTPRDNILKYGQPMMAKHTAPRFDVFVHPNNKRGDALTCFIDNKLSWPVYSYMSTLETMLCCAPDLLTSAGVTDDAILRIGQLGPNLSTQWNINVKDEVEMMLQRPTSTVRMVILALLIHALGVNNQLPYSGRFVQDLLEDERTRPLVPEIIKFITVRMETEHLVNYCRPVAEKLWQQSQMPIEYLQSMAAHFHEELATHLNHRISHWYDKLRANLDRRYPEAVFDNLRAAATPRDSFKDNYFNDEMEV